MNPVPRPRHFLQGSVALMPVGLAHTFRAFADEDGRFRFEGLPDVECFVRAFKPLHSGPARPGGRRMRPGGEDLELVAE